MAKINKIFLHSIPILIMVVLIPVVKDDYVLLGLYLLISVISMRVIKYTKSDLTVYIFGLIALTIFETFFIKTGVEVFVRNSLFGIMPIWLPFLWAYGFVAIKRGIKILES
ncbi:MAG: hypothetical protein WAW92_02435 [Minisyncoccia bacterium]